MKKFLSLMLLLVGVLTLTACSTGGGMKAIELMGAGDRIHDTFTFANTGVKIEETSNNVYQISGSVEKLDSMAVKKEFKIDEDVTHVVAIKLTAIGTEVKEDEVTISVNGNKAYDAEHLNGSDYTFIILEAKPDSTATISVKWSKEDSEKIYIIYFANNLSLK